MTEMKLALVGLGRMGLGMATRLHAAGLTPLCYDPSPDRCGLADEAGIEVASSLADAVAACDAAILSLPDDKAVGQVCAEIAASAAAGCVVIDTSTIAVASVKILASQLKTIDVHYLDAPVSGGPLGASEGKLTMMVGGDEAALAKVKPVLDALCARVTHAGPPGCGQVVKLANNILLATHMVAAAEAVRMAEGAGVSAETLLDVVNAASGRSGATEVNMPRWVVSGRFDSGFAAGLMRKDVGLAVKLARDTGVDSPVLDRAAETWLERSLQHVPGEMDFNRVLSWVMNGGDG